MWPLSFTEKNSDQKHKEKIFTIKKLHTSEMLKFYAKIRREC